MFTFEPPDSGTKTTVPAVVSKFDPLITIVALPLTLLSIFAAVTSLPPSILNTVIAGGLSIYFQVVPS